MNLSNQFRGLAQALRHSTIFLTLMTTSLIVSPSAFAGSEASRISTNSYTGSTLMADVKTDINKWWNGKSAFENWFGLGDTLSAHGLTVTGQVKQTWLDQTIGGYGSASGQPTSNFLNEERLNALLNFGKLFNIESLNGLIFSSTWRYRNVGSNPGFAAGTASGPSQGFAPSADTSGLGVRILPQFLQWQSDSSKDPNFLIKGGWVNPYEDFLQQPLSKDFQNNNIASAKGIGNNTLGNGIYYYNGNSAQAYKSSSIPWSSSYAAWGGSLRVKPTKETYVQLGLYEAITQSTGIPATQISATQVYPYTQVPSSYAGRFNSTGLVYQQVGAQGQLLYNANGTPKLAAQGYVPSYNQNHGFNFQGSPNSGPNYSSIGTKSSVNQTTGVVTPAGNIGGDGGYNSQNGLYNVNEIGWTPKFGKDKLEGKYALGSYIWGQQNTSFTPVSYSSAFTTKPYSTLINQVQWGLYLQGDQRLYAVKEEVSAPSLSKNPLDGKNPVAPTGTRVTDKGLYAFNEYTYTPPQNSALTQYFQTGLVYKGLIPHRDNDSVGIALGAGFYSSQYNSYINSQNKALVNAYTASANATVPNGPTFNTPKALTGTGSTTSTYYGAYLPAFSSTEVIEAYYKVQLNKFASISPDLQWIFNPAGNGSLGNELVVGVSAKVTF